MSIKPTTPTEVRDALAALVQAVTGPDPGRGCGSVADCLRRRVEDDALPAAERGRWLCEWMDLMRGCMDAFDPRTLADDMASLYVLGVLVAQLCEPRSLIERLATDPAMTPDPAERMRLSVLLEQLDGALALAAGPPPCTTPASTNADAAPPAS